MDSFSEIWDMVCDYCKTQMTTIAFKAWISRIEPIKLDIENEVAYLKVPNNFHKKTIDQYYVPTFQEAFFNIFGNEINIKLISAEDEENSAKKSNSYIDKLQQNLGEYEYTFDTFIVGSSNKFAHAAAVAISEKPATTYNPFFIYGNSGLGKTHLLYAIKNAIRKKDENCNIIYIKGDDFTNELINSIKRGSTLEFHDKYRNTDVLLVDDIQFIAGKDSTQEEFFHTFNTLYESQKQIVLTSDRPPKEIKTLEDRLRTRFEWGLIADIQPPDYETRIAIIKRKAELMEFKLPNEMCKYIADKLKSNIRQLEGTVKKIRAYCMLTKEEPTMKIAQDAISQILNNDQPAPVTVEKIIGEVGRTYEVSSEDIRSSKRAANISKARKISMYLTREITQMSLNAIGDEFGGRDHSTVVYALKEIEKEIELDSNLKSMIEDIEKNIRSSNY